MSKIINVEIKGLDRLRKRWKNIDKESKKIIQKALLKSGYLVERNAKKEAPVDSGRLRSSISLNDSLLTRANPMVTVAPNVKYAIYVHDGHRSYKGNPFMERSYKESKNKINAIFKKAMDQIVKKMK